MAMAHETHSARIIVPMPYTGPTGAGKVPPGPCILEGIDEKLIDIIWGPEGQKSAQFTIEDLKSAAARGDVVLLD